MIDRHKQLVADYFSQECNHWRDVYQDTNAIDNPLFQISNRKKTILHYVDEFADNALLKVLDVGCGTGQLVQDLSTRGHLVVGVDISWDVIKTAHSAADPVLRERTFYILGDAESLPFSEESFDVVTCVGVLSYMRTDAVCMKEMCRIVRPGGVLLITLPNLLRINNILDPYYYLFRIPQFLLYKSFGRAGDRVTVDDFGKDRNFLIRKYRYKQLNYLSKENRLSIKKITGLGFGPFTFWRKAILSAILSQKISDYFERLSAKKAFSILNIFVNHWVIYFQKPSL